MSDEIVSVGRLFIAHEVLQNEKWIVDQVVSAAKSQLNKYKPLDGFLTPSSVRTGDFSLVLSNYKPSPIIVEFIGIPGRGRAAIIQELFTV